MPTNRFAKTARETVPGRSAKRSAPVAKKRAPVPRSATLVHRHVLCGRCPKLHGPYWYAAWKEGGRTRWRYIGGDGAMSRFLAERERVTTGLQESAKVHGRKLATRRACVECGQAAGATCTTCGKPVCSATQDNACHLHAHGRPPRRR